MSAFTIFFLVVTFLYVLYYAVIITLDLNAKPKTDGTQVETVDTEGMIPDNDEGLPDDTVSDDEEETTSAPVVEHDTPIDAESDLSPFAPHGNEIQPETQQPFDNPYGLGDEDETSLEASTAEIDSPSDETEHNQEEPNPDSTEDGEEPEPQIQFFGPEPSNGGIAEDINNSQETLIAESLTPCTPNMLATEVLDIVSIRRSFYGSEEDENHAEDDDQSHDNPEESTLSDKLPMENDEESLVLDRI